MVARVTLAEIDAVRTRVEDAVQLFEDSVVPALSEQDGYEGVYVLVTPEGKALVMTFWEDEEAAAVRSFQRALRTPAREVRHVLPGAARPRDVRRRRG